MIFYTTDKYLTVARVKKNPTIYFVFGDNLLGRGKMGQAVIRGLPNAVGVPTKKRPSMSPGSFFTDDEYELNVQAIEVALATIPSGSRVMVPVGLGRGLSQLDIKAPKTYAYLRKRLKICDLE